MHYYFTAVSTVAGICLGFGILYLFSGFRRKDSKRLNLLFAVFALSYAGTLLNGVRYHSTGSLEAYLLMTRWDAVFIVAAYVSLLWYVAHYTHVKSRIFLTVLSAAFIIPGVVNIIRSNLLHDEIIGLTFIILPWGEQLTTIEATGTIWRDVFLLAQLTLLGYILFACFRQFRRGERQAAVLLAVGMLWFIVTIVYELVSETGIVAYFPLGEFGFLGIAIAVSLQMSNSIIKTEEELEQHQQNLEGLVEIRTTELSQTNKELAEEISQHKQTEQALNRRVEELAFLHQTSQTINTTTDLPAELRQVAEMITFLFDARSTSIVMMSEPENKLNMLTGFVCEPVPVEATDMFSHSLTKMPLLTREALNTGEARVISDIQSLSLPPKIHGAVIALNIQSIMVVPLIVRGDSGGLLYISTDQIDRVFTQDEIQLAETTASDLAVAIENVRLLKMAKSSAAAEERSRIARELHDSVTQTLYSVSIVAEALPRVLERSVDEAKRNVVYLRQTTLGALAEMRTLLFELRPDTLVKAGLPVLLQQLADVLTGRTRVPVEVTTAGDIDLSVEEKIALYRIAQETFNNIHKHSQATLAWVTLQRKSEEVILTIRDNGRGFDPASVQEGHLGLQSMQERADEIGARFNLESEPGQGTQILVSILIDSTTLDEETP